MNDILTEQQHIHYLASWSAIRYIDGILESLNKPSVVTVLQNNSNTFTSTFMVNDIKYLFRADIFNTFVIVSFHPLDMEVDIYKERKDGTYSGRVFASVFRSLDVLIKHNPQIIEIGFTADYKKLEPLYRLMEPVILKKFPKWKLDKKFNNAHGKLQYNYIRK